MVKTFKHIGLTLFISFLLVACATNSNDRDDMEDNQDAPLEERGRNDLPDESDRSENQLDRDPNNENILPDVETEDENREDR
ncbi:MAG TPA: hypothetical protein VK079_03245 [Bacillota bacterium]|nr:hypothetical protein [Bacillota bacterium]